VSGYNNYADEIVFKAVFDDWHQIADVQQLAVRLPHMAPAAVIGETGNGLNPL
jgi:hypothetical protein